MTPEGLVKDKVKKFLNSIKAYYTMPVGSGWGNSGVPDFMCCVEGLFIGIECKAGKNQPTALQLKHKKQIEESGGEWILVTDQEDSFILLRLNIIYLKENRINYYGNQENISKEG